MKIELETKVEASAEDLYDWHARKSAFERLLPPWEKVNVVEMGDGLDVGRRSVLQMSFPWGKRLWIGEHTRHQKYRFFEDTQIDGPFKKWIHLHSFKAESEGRSRLVDSIEYDLPFPPVGNFLGDRVIRKKLNEGFNYRHEIVRNDLILYRKFKDKFRLKILIAGGSGFIGSALRCLLETQGHEVFILTRKPKEQSDIGWDPVVETIEFNKNSRFDAVINLSGESLVSSKWTEKSKESFWRSRVDATRFLVNSLRLLNRPPRIFISGSAVGIYGDRGDVQVDESFPSGCGYLADLCSAWEAEAYHAGDFADRVAVLRTGVVIDPRGGALKQMLGPFKIGVGGPLGDGQQWMPWIAMEDWLYAAYEILMSESGIGAFNLVSNKCARNEEFSKDLATVLKRPCLFRVPEAVLMKLFGEMAEEALLTSQHVIPGRLESELGFQFRYSKASDAFCSML